MISLTERQFLHIATNQEAVWIQLVAAASVQHVEWDFHIATSWKNVSIFRMQASWLPSFMKLKPKHLPNAGVERQNLLAWKINAAYSETHIWIFAVEWREERPTNERILLSRRPSLRANSSFEICKRNRFLNASIHLNIIFMFRMLKVIHWIAIWFQHFVWWKSLFSVLMESLDEPTKALHYTLVLLTTTVSWVKCSDFLSLPECIEI